MKVLVVGASGATGRLLVEQLLDGGHDVKAIVRSVERMPEHLKNHERLSLICAGLLELSENEIAGHVKEVDAVASCLGHNLTIKGVFGPPRKLVTIAIRRLCTAVKTNKPSKPIRFVLMNTAGNTNRDLKEKRSFGEKCVTGLIRLLVPPQSDNEQAADYLRTTIGQDDREIEWAVVRPDSLIDEKSTTEYETFSSPTRSPIFNAGQTSRINVGHFMAELLTNDNTWNKWKGKMPVIYNT